METRGRILAEIDAAFSEPPPDWFGPEFQGQALKLMRGWFAGDPFGNPIIFIEPNGFKYFLPAMARLAYGTGSDFILDKALHALARERIATFTERQRAAVEAVLIDLSEAIGPELDPAQSEQVDCAMRRIRGELCASDHEQERILSEIREAFAVPRPDWFCDANHCSECARYDATLQSRDLDSLDYETVAYLDPVTSITNPDGFKYFMPALARLACVTGNEYYFDQFLQQLH